MNDHKAIDDGALVLLAQQGDTKAFDKLWEMHREAIMAITLSILPRSSDADDVVQLVALKSWRKLPKFRQDCAFATWVHTLTRNTCLDFMRSNKKRWALENDIEEELTQSEIFFIADYRNPGEQHERDDFLKSLRKDLYRALRQLSPEHQKVLVCDMQDMSYAEGGIQCGCVMGTFASRLSYARRKLKEILSLQMQEAAA
jgi:RNA polymerase sigma factor (sigma-70 family)